MAGVGGRVVGGLGGLGGLGGWGVGGLGGWGLGVGGLGGWGGVGGGCNRTYYAQPTWSADMWQIICSRIRSC